MPGDALARDANYIYLYGEPYDVKTGRVAGPVSATRYRLKDDAIIPGHLDGEYHLIYSFRGNKSTPVDEMVNGGIFIVSGYYNDGDTDWYIADYERNKPDSSKIKMDMGPALLIKIGSVNGKKELIEGLVSTETRKCLETATIFILMVLED